MSKYLFWFDDAYGCEQMFTFKGSARDAQERAVNLCYDGCDCLTVEDQETGEIVFDQRDYLKHHDCYTLF